MRYTFIGLCTVIGNNNNNKLRAPQPELKPDVDYVWRFHVTRLVDCKSSFLFLVVHILPAPVSYSNQEL